jgi:hypothetical protein
VNEQAKISNQAKKAAKAEARATKARRAGIKALHAIANDTRKYSADARVKAARALYEYGKGN